MATLLDRLQRVSQPSLWVSVFVAAVVVLAFPLFLSFGPDSPPDMVIEGVYLLLAFVAAIPIRRLETGLLSLGWQIFVLGRLVDFMDELFVEPEPFVEPYLSELLMVISLTVLVAGTYTLLRERDRRVAELEDRTDELALKNKVIDEAPVGVTIADMTEEDEPLIHVNDAFTRMTGYEASETVGRNCRFLQGDDTDPEKVDRMRAAIDDGGAVQVTVRNYRKDGTRFWNEITLAPIPAEDGSIPHYAGFQQDATERKQYERRLREQRDGLDVLNQMLRHDIRNELQLVTANATILEEHVAGDAAERLDTISDAAWGAIALTDTARDLSETMLKLEPDRRSIPLRDTVESEVDALRTAFDHVSVDVEGRIPDVTVTADDMLDSVFRNGLRNAVQHNDKDRPEITVSASRAGDHVEVRIADNGPGIPDERKADIFGRGEKGLQSEGTGIGMYLIDTLASRYGGDAWIEDNDPEGTVLAVELPLSEP